MAAKTNQLLSVIIIITNSVIIGFFPKISSILKIQEVWYGSHKPISHHGELKEYLRHSFELWEFWKVFWNCIFPCVVSG